MIRENITRVRARIPPGITIVAVSKTRTPQQLKEALKAGIADIGENRVQEALIKYKELSAVDYRPSAIKWHMVGHLQTNKVKEAVKIFDLIHSVDSIRLAVEIDKQAAGISKLQDILIEVKTSPEATKFGLAPDEVIAVIKEIAGLKNINIKGLMTIAPILDDPEKTRPYFRTLRELKDEINRLPVLKSPLSVLSMGMSDDFEVAIEEGSNMIRLGRAIFEG
jgi:pyridoxal phosphate enzyme (YggS family)